MYWFGSSRSIKDRLQNELMMKPSQGDLVFASAKTHNSGTGSLAALNQVKRKTSLRTRFRQRLKSYGQYR